VTALYFILDAWLKKYLLMYVFVTKTESGGQFWRILFNRMIFATLFANVVIGLVVKARGTWYMVGALAPLPLLLLGFKWYCVRTFDDDIQFYTRSMNDSEALASKKLKMQRVSSKFGHPALWKSLITPMVHAKAQHVLGQVYRRRLGSENAPSTMGYSDIAMEPMERDQPGKPAESAPFEIVQEGQMDFSFYKNRPDLRDEFGGGLYGKPEDLISERSQTPVSFAGMPTPGGYRSPSPSSSRGTSPDRVTFPKQFEDSAYPGDHNHPAFRGDRRAPSAGAGDIASARPLYTNPNESEGGLLSGAQDMPTSEPGILGMDRWRTGGTGYGPVEQQEEDPVSYDYYRAHRDV
jgi:calcium permeable stress-gated cation channel